MSKSVRLQCFFCLLVMVAILSSLVDNTRNDAPRQVYVNDSFSLEDDFYPNYEVFQAAAQVLWENKDIFLDEGYKHPIILGNSTAESIYAEFHFEKSISLDDWNRIILLDRIKKIYEISFTPALWDGETYSLPYFEFVYVVEKEHIYESHIIYCFQIDQADESAQKALNKSIDYICQNKDYGVNFFQMEPNHWYYFHFTQK